MGYDRIRDGFVCDNTKYAHPFVTLAFTCAEDAESDCKFSVLVEAKYTNGSSWGLDHFTQSDSDYLPKNLTLSPGERTEVTFQNSTKIKQCWPKSESVKRLTIALRDRSGELKDLSASYRP